MIMHEFLNEIQGKNYTHLPLSDDGELNINDWAPSGVPLGGDKFWMYQDRNARISFPGEMMHIDIDRFSLAHDQVQIFDNPKHLYLTKEHFRPGNSGKLTFSCLMKSHILEGNPKDYRDGFGSFNVLDFNSGMVFDIISNGAKLWIIYERLLIPGVIDEKDAFTHVIPINRPTHANELLQCSIVFDRESGTAKYYIDFDLIYESPELPVEVETLQGGFGFITLHMIENGKSTSCRGQGGRGLWGDFRVYSY
jgi:hypothetical protein